MEETPTLDDYRTGYISERHGVSDNAAKALQLQELGFSHSGIASVLDVTEGTARGYLKEIDDALGRDASFNHKLDKWGNRDISDFKTAGYSEGVADAERVNGKRERPYWGGGAPRNEGSIDWQDPMPNCSVN